VHDTRTSETPSSTRLISLDALRGLDMAFIIGFGALLAALAHMLQMPELALQFEHVEWEGFRVEDLIFPLFIFLAGVSLTFSLSRSVEKHGRGGAARRLVRRCAVLFLIGVIFNGGFNKGIEEVRWMGVLQRIALATLGAGLMYIWFNARDLFLAAVSILVGYWALLEFTHGGSYAEGTNFVNHFDSKWLPGRKHGGKPYDPEGILSTFPAISTALWGVLAGSWLGGTAAAGKKAAGLVALGAVLFAIGWVWGWGCQSLPFIHVPVIKKLWTSSFVLVAAGWSAVLLGVFYWLVEVCRLRFLAYPWVWIGANSITIYLVAHFVRPLAVAERFTGPRQIIVDGKAQPNTPEWIVYTVAFLLIVLFARYLYKKGVFIRV
jgi:predicted acyltransferase